MSTSRKSAAMFHRCGKVKAVGARFTLVNGGTYVGGSKGLATGSLSPIIQVPSTDETLVDEGEVPTTSEDQSQSNDSNPSPNTVMFDRVRNIVLRGTVVVTVGDGEYYEEGIGMVSGSRKVSKSGIRA